MSRRPKTRYGLASKGGGDTLVADAAELANYNVDGFNKAIHLDEFVGIHPRMVPINDVEATAAAARRSAWRAARDGPKSHPGWTLAVRKSDVSRSMTGAAG